MSFTSGNLALTKRIHSCCVRPLASTARPTLSAAGVAAGAYLFLALAFLASSAARISSADDPTGNPTVGAITSSMA